MKRPLRNLGSMLVSDAGSRVIGFLLTAYLARTLAPSGFGILSIGLAVLGHLSVLGSPGMQVVEARNVAARREGLVDRVSAVLTVRLVIAAILIGLTWLITGVALESAPVRDVVRLYAATLVPYALLLDWFFQGKEDFLRVGIARFLTYVAYGVMLILLVRSAGDLRLAPVAFLFGNIVTTIFLAVAYAKEVPAATLRWDPAMWGTVLRENLPVGVALLLAQIVANFPPLVVGYFLSIQDVGVYSAALKLIYLLLLVDRLFNALFLPVITRYGATKRDEVPFLVSVMLKVLVLGLLPVIVLAIGFAGPAVAFVFGNGYEDAAPLVRIMAAFVGLTVVNSLYVCALIGSGRERDYSQAMTAGTAVLALAAVVFTWLFGTPGAAAALLVGESATVILMMRKARRATLLPGAIVVARPLAGLVIMAGVLLFLRPLPVASIVAVAVYGILMVGLKALNPEEIRYLRERFV